MQLGVSHVGTVRSPCTGVPTAASCRGCHLLTARREVPWRLVVFSLAVTKLRRPAGPLPPLPPLPSRETSTYVENGNEDIEEMGARVAPKQPREEVVPVRLLGPTATAFVQDASRREKPREFYMLQPKDDGPRPLSWEEARIDFLPVGETVRGVVEEIRPYGSFIGLVVNGMATGRFGEDSQIRGFCEELQLTEGWMSPGVGEQVAVKILYVDEMKRVHLSISEASPQWPQRQERVLHSPAKYEDPDFFPLP